VLFFTTALFLSGYAIQLRTLRDLRAAINQDTRPGTPEPPKIFLPDRFKQKTTELADGTIVAVDPSPHVGGRPQTVVEVRPTLTEEQQQRGAGGTASGKDGGARGSAGAQGKKAAGETVGGGEGRKQKPISRAERRRRIKEDLQRLSHATERVYYQRRLY
jgi:hypothetical protein